MLVDDIQLLAKHKQQWGVGVSSASGTTTLTYHLAYSNFAAVFTGNTSGDKSTSPVNMTNVGLSSCRIHVKDDARYYADRFNWFALGFQQWGTYETANASNKLITITFPVSFAVTAYSVTLGHKGFSNWTNGANVNYVNKTVSDMTVYYCDGYGFSWLAIGMQQWGVYTTGKRNITITLPIATSVTYAVIAVARTTNSIGCTGSQNCQYVSNVTSKTFQAGSYDAGNGYAGFWWLSISKAQALPKAHRLKHCYIPTAIQLIFVPLYVGQIIELLVLAIHDVFSNVAPDHDSCAVVIQ